MGQCYVFLIFAVCLSMQIQPLLSRRPGTSRWGFHFGNEDASCDLPTIRKGRARWLRRPIARVTCISSAYELIGMKYITCKYGEWDESLPVCARAGCEVPVVPNSLTNRRYGNALLEFFCLPGHKLVGEPVIYCNGAQWNATAPSCLSISAPPVLSCNFDSDMCGWQQDDTSEFDWTRINTKTPSSKYQTGPSQDHTTGAGFYMYIESTGQPENKTARLLSPVYDYKLSRDGCFSFFYHMYGRYLGGLRVYQRPIRVALDDLKDDELLFEKWYNQGDQWLESVTKLKNVSEYFQIVIEGVRGESFTSDIAIDDVALLQAENCSATALRPLMTTSQPLESCMDRCNQAPEANSSDCSCTWDCFVEGTCCQDILYVCIDKLTTESLGVEETEKSDSFAIFVPSTMEPKSATLLATPPPRTLKTTSTPTTTKPITTTKTTTNSRATTTTQKPRRIQTITKPTAAAALNVTGTPKEPNRTTTEKPTPPAAHLPKTTIKQAYNPRGSQNVSSRVSDTAKLPRVLETKSSTSGKATAITFAVLLCCLAVACAAIAARTARGRAALARLRGRTTSSTEVRYLTADTDD